MIQGTPQMGPGAKVLIAKIMGGKAKQVIGCSLNICFIWGNLVIWLL